MGTEKPGSIISEKELLDKFTDMVDSLRTRDKYHLLLDVLDCFLEEEKTESFSKLHLEVLNKIESTK